MVSLGDFIPGVNFISHTINHIGDGVREEGLVGVGKVLAKAYQEDIALSVAVAASGVGTAAVVGAELALFGADAMGALDLPSEAEAKAQAAAAEVGAEDGFEPETRDANSSTLTSAAFSSGPQPTEAELQELASRVKMKDGGEPPREKLVELWRMEKSLQDAKANTPAAVPHW